MIATLLDSGDQVVLGKIIDIKFDSLLKPARKKICYISPIDCEVSAELSRSFVSLDSLRGSQILMIIQSEKHNVRKFAAAFGISLIISWAIFPF
jgi:hypothetical protein